ncbi:GntR family transcriptional regulator [Streptomyces sp. NPDC059153]|uniref:GntR family transcriptional regulator n=1 Tax=Streptomyces sp. NPDC059153 TaxID=3346743 RepID=UPI0036ACD2A3
MTTKGISISVNHASPVPPYEQLRVQLADLISIGHLTQGDRLPSVRQLASDLGLANNTVVRAYRELETAGLVKSREVLVPRSSPLLPLPTSRRSSRYTQAVTRPPPDSSMPLTRKPSPQSGMLSHVAIHRDLRENHSVPLPPPRLPAHTKGIKVRAALFGEFRGAFAGAVEPRPEFDHYARAERGSGLAWPGALDTVARDPGGMARLRFCDDACRAQAYRDWQVADRTWRLGLTLAEAEPIGDTGMIRLLTCPVCGRITSAGGDRRRDASYCSGRCRSRAWRRRATRIVRTA